MTWTASFLRAFVAPLSSWGDADAGDFSLASPGVLGGPFKAPLTSRRRWWFTTTGVDKTCGHFVCPQVLLLASLLCPRGRGHRREVFRRAPSPALFPAAPCSCRLGATLVVAPIRRGPQPQDIYAKK
jgi:hypothetical protein